MNEALNTFGTPIEYYVELEQRTKARPEKELVAKNNNSMYIRKTDGPALNPP